MGDEKRSIYLGQYQARGEISQEHIRVFFALHRTLFASCTPSGGNVLVARSEKRIGSSAWEQTDKVPPCMALQVRYSAHISKTVLKKWRAHRIITNVIRRLERTLARDRMKAFSLLSHQKREPER